MINVLKIFVILKAIDLKYYFLNIVARMAYDILQKEAPNALKKAEDVLAVMANETITDSERDYPFVEAAPFADMVKYKGGGW